MARFSGGRWTGRVTNWEGPGGQRGRGRPHERWTGEIKTLRR